MNRRLLRFAECFALCGGIPAVFAFLPGWLERVAGLRLKMWVVPVLIVIAIAAWALLRGTGALKRGELLRWNVSRADLLRVFARFAVCAAILTGTLALWRPEWLLSFPLKNPKFWLVVCFAYPVVSVFPQGVIYRVLWEKRYAGLFPGKWSLIAGAMFFGWAHIVFHNVWACAFTFIGGLFFLSGYRRTGSVLFSDLEHALYGDFLFTIGWGTYFYEGTQAAIRAAS